MSSNARFTDEELLTCVELNAKYGSYAKAAFISGMTKSAFRRRIHSAAERGMISLKPVMPGYVIKSVSSKADDGSWVKQTKAPGDVFEVPTDHVVSGVSAYTDAEGRIVGMWTKTKAETTAVDIVKAMQGAFDAYKGRAELIPSPSAVNDDLMSVYILADVHHGMLSWGAETGDDYDIAIGSRRLRQSMTDLIAQSPPSAEALILNLGDYFHSNDQTNATPASKHQLDLDSRFYKVVTTGIRLFMDCVDLALQKHARVRVRCLPGNHDPESSLALTVALSAFYHAEPRVIIEEDPSDFFFQRFGETLIGACHGHKMKPERMAMCMAEMRREDWGASKFRWFLFGHIHHETVTEVGSVRCESFQTLASKDAYAASHGYHAGQSLTSVTLHRDRGETGRHRINIVPK